MTTKRGTATKWQWMAAMVALAMGPACDDQDESSSRRPLLEDEEEPEGGRPPTPVTGMTTYDRAAAVPGFSVEISLGGPAGEDVVLDWSSTGFTGDVTIYRATDPSALLDVSEGAPLPAGVTATTVSGTTSWADAGAASRSVQTPHYFYRVGLLAGGTGDGGAAYVRSQDGGAPWGQSANEQAMDLEFGAGAWSDLRFETVDVDALFSSQYAFVYLEGSDGGATELETFLANNQVLLEEWVDAGGTLFLNAAPNEGGSQSWGFGGVTLHNSDFPVDPGAAVDPSHPIWGGPFLPTSLSFTGSYYAHASVSGPGLVPHIIDANGGNPNLAELDWGLGRVMFGGLTTSNFWNPAAESLNLRANVIDYLAESEPATSLQLSTLVMKTTTATAQGYNRFGLCMLDGPASAAELQAQLGSAVVGVHQWNADTQSYTSYLPGGVDFPLLYGSAVVAQLDASADAFHSLVGVVPTNEALAVTGEPGNNWTTLPVFYDGPTSTSYWVDTVGYWGIGQRDNLTQTDQWDWRDPGYEPFEMEPCGAYDMFLPGNACTTNDDCSGDQFCYFVEPAACGEVAAGLCFGRPLGCENVPESPVCGCDGQEYASQCEADLAGIGVRRPADGVPCNAPPVCGDGHLDPGEQCDGGDLGEATCASQGFDGGTLGCTADCTFDTAACTNGTQVCDAGDDPISGLPWVVCAADADQAWVSHANPGGGNFHPEVICAELGYDGFGEFGGTCGNVCGYCQGGTSCEAPGNQTFDGSGSCGTDAGGQILCNTVMWQCVNDDDGGGPGEPPACVEQDLGEAIGPGVASGSTVGEDEDLAQTCGASGGPDRVLRFVAPASGTFVFEMIGSSYDTVLSLHDTCGGPALVCNDDFHGLQSQVTLAMNEGQEILVAVSGYAGNTGSWVLNIAQQ